MPDPVLPPPACRRVRKKGIAKKSASVGRVPRKVKTIRHPIGTRLRVSHQSLIGATVIQKGPTDQGQRWMPTKTPLPPRGTSR